MFVEPETFRSLLQDRAHWGWDPTPNVEVEAPVKPKTGGYATLLTSMEILTALYPGVFPETPEQTETRRNHDWDEMNAAIKVVTAPLGQRGAEEKDLGLQVRVKARLDELSFMSAMSSEIAKEDWFERRVKQLNEMLTDKS